MCTSYKQTMRSGDARRSKYTSTSARGAPSLLRHKLAMWTASFCKTLGHCFVERNGGIAAVKTSHHPTFHDGVVLSRVVDYWATHATHTTQSGQQYRTTHATHTTYGVCVLSRTRPSHPSRGVRTQHNREVLDHSRHSHYSHHAIHTGHTIMYSAE